MMEPGLKPDQSVEDQIECHPEYIKRHECHPLMNPYIGSSSDHKTGEVCFTSDADANVVIYYDTSYANTPGRTWTVEIATAWVGQNLNSVPVDDNGSYDPSKFTFKAYNIDDTTMAFNKTTAHHNHISNRE